MNEQVVQMSLMWILAGLSAGWLAETSMNRRGYGLIVDMGLGVGAGLAGGSAFLTLFGLRPGMIGMFVVGFGAAISVIFAQRFGWPAASDARDLKAGRRVVGLGHPARGEEGAVSGPPVGGEGRPGRLGPSRALARMATTGIYLLRGVPRELQQAARGRAVREGTTLRQVLLQGLGEYAAGTWTPQPDVAPPVARTPGVGATGR